MTAPTPLLDIYEQDLDSLVQEVAGVPHPHCVIGQGYGSRDAQQKWAAMDPTWKGPWFEETINIENGFLDTGGILIPLTQAQYNDRQVDVRYKAIGEIGGIRPNPGDYARLWLDGESNYRLLQIQDLEVSPSGKLTLQLGKRAFDEIDAFNAKKSLGNAYLDGYLTKSANSISNSGTITIGDDTAGWGAGCNLGNYTIPAAVNGAANNCRVTLDIALTLAPGVPQAEGELYIDSGGPFQNGYFNHYLLGDPITGIDMTPFINWGAATPLKIYVKLRGQWIGGAPTGNSLSATFNAWRRITNA